MPENRRRKKMPRADRGEDAIPSPPNRETPASDEGMETPEVSPPEPTPEVTDEEIETSSVREGRAPRTERDAEISEEMEERRLERIAEESGIPEDTVRDLMNAPKEARDDLDTAIEAGLDPQTAALLTLQSPEDEEARRGLLEDAFTAQEAGLDRNSLLEAAAGAKDQEEFRTVLNEQAAEQGILDGDESQGNQASRRPGVSSGFAQITGLGSANRRRKAVEVGPRGARVNRGPGMSSGFYQIRGLGSFISTGQDDEEDEQAPAEIETLDDLIEAITQRILLRLREELTAE